MSSFHEVRFAEGFEHVLCVRGEDYDVLQELDGTPTGVRWRPIDVRFYREQGDARSDFPSLSVSRPLVMRERAVHAMKDLLDGNGEVLRLSAEDDDDDLFVFNARVVDVLDEERCDLLRFRSGEIMQVRQAAFFEERLEGVDAFCVPQGASRIYVSQRFIDRYRDAGLVGLEFVPVWTGNGAPPPIPPTLIPSGPVPRAFDSDCPLDPDVAEEIASYVMEGLQLLGRTSLEDPAGIVAAIRTTIDRLRADTDDDEIPIKTTGCLAFLWGQAVVVELGWEWVELKWQGEETFGIVSRDRSLVILAVHLMDEWLCDPERDNTSLLLFNMLVAGDVPSATAGDYRLLW